MPTNIISQFIWGVLNFLDFHGSLSDWDILTLCLKYKNRDIIEKYLQTKHFKSYVHYIRVFVYNEIRNDDIYKLLSPYLNNEIKFFTNHYSYNRYDEYLFTTEHDIIYGTVRNYFKWTLNFDIIDHLLKNYRHLIKSSLINNNADESYNKYKDLKILKLLESDLNLESLFKIIIQLSKIKELTPQYLNYIHKLILSHCPTTISYTSVLSKCLLYCLSNDNFSIDICNSLLDLGAQFPIDFHGFCRVRYLDVLEYLLNRGHKFNQDNINRLYEDLNHTCHTPPSKFNRVINRIKSTI
jgi:hypothetical protein